MKYSEAFQQQYDVKSVLGEGGMGRVMLAEDRQLKRLVAIKLLADFDDGPDGLLRQRFVEEARVCASFKHPNIVRMFSSGFEDGKPYMVFEYVEGEDVAKRLEAETRLAVADALALAAAALEGLQYAHDHRVIHRDIKPGNVMLRADGGEPMLMDFGVAKAATGRSFKTQAHLILGTPLYMAPELIKREEVGPGIDVYALGCMLYECLAGKPPFTGKSDIVVLDMHLNAKAESLRALRPEVPEDVELLVERAMEKDPVRRFRTAAEMAGWVSTIRTGGRVPRAKTVPQLPSPSGATTKPEIAAPAKLSSRGGARRGAPTVVQGARRRRAAALLAVALAGVLLGVLAWRRAGGAPSDVRLAYGNAGFEVAWRTQHATRGVVFHRALEGEAGFAADGTLDRPPAHAGMTRLDEEGTATEHRLLLTELRAGDRVVVSVAGPSGESAWARAVLVPPGVAARQVVAQPGATATRVVAQTGRVRRPRLEARPLKGAPLDLSPVEPDLAELSFDVPLAPEQLSEASRVVAEQAADVRVTLPVRTLTGIAGRLLQRLDGISPARIIGSIVTLREYDRNLDFDNMLAATPWLGAPDMPTDVRRRRVPDGFFRDKVKLALEPEGRWQALEEFRSWAPYWFTAAGVPDDQKRAMYASLLKLEHLDGLIRGQMDAANQLGVAAVYEPLVRAVHEKPGEVPGPPAGAEEVARGVPFVSEDYNAWGGLASWCRDFGLYKGLVAKTLPTKEECRKLFAFRKTFRVKTPAGAGGPGMAVLTAQVAILGPNYYYDVTLPGTAGPFTVRLAQPVTAEWRRVMDDAASTAEDPPFAQMAVHFPARLLAAGGTTVVELQYHHLPGATWAQLNEIPRASILKGLWLSVRP